VAPAMTADQQPAGGQPSSSSDTTRGTAAGGADSGSGGTGTGSACASRRSWKMLGQRRCPLNIRLVPQMAAASQRRKPPRPPPAVAVHQRGRPQLQIWMQEFAPRAGWCRCRSSKCHMLGGAAGVGVRRRHRQDGTSANFSLDLPVACNVPHL